MYYTYRRHGMKIFSIVQATSMRNHGRSKTETIIDAVIVIVIRFL